MIKNKAVQYGIEAVLHIARRNAEGHMKGVQAKEIAEAHDLPVAYAAKVMSQLARQRILRSDRGPQGGFRIAVDLKELTLLQIHEAIDGPLDWAKDVEQSDMAEGTQDTLVEFYSAASDAVRKALSVKISTLIRDKVGAT